MYNTDSLPAADLLNRRPFANQIADSFMSSFQNGENSFVFGINGKWGSGKTVLMDFLKDSIRDKMVDRDHTLIIDFNPWMFSGKDELLSIFLQQVTRELGPKGERLREGIAGLAKAVAYLDGVKYIDSRLGKIQKWIQGLLDGASKKRSVTDLKDAVDKIITEEKFRLFVFIDDIDRLTPKEIVEIFQIIKLNASFKNTVFVVSYDKDIVQNVLHKQHGFNAAEYLEKIIQVDYRIPDLLEETLWQILLLELKAFMTAQKVELDEGRMYTFWSVYRLKYYFRNLRHVYRYMNALRVRFPSIRNEVKQIEFLIIEAMRIFDYSSYEIIQRNYKREIQFGPNTNSKRITEQLTNSTTIELYKVIFGKQTYADNDYTVANPQYFDRYFGLVLRSVDIKEEIVSQYLSHDDSRRYIVENAITTGTIGSLLGRLKLKEIDIDQFVPLLKWPAGFEQRFWDNRSAYMTLLQAVVEKSEDKVLVLKRLVTELSYDDGHFNPARFSLLSELSMVRSEGVFFKYKTNLSGVSEKALEIEKHMLKKHESDFLTFPKQSYHIEAFYRLFFREYKERYDSNGYSLKLDTYWKTQENVLFFLRLIIPGIEDPVFDPYWACHLLDVKLFGALEKLVGRIELSTVDAEDSKYVKAFSNHGQAIWKKLME